MHDAGKPADDHARAKSHGEDEMLAIGFADRCRVFGEKAFHRAVDADSIPYKVSQGIAFCRQASRGALSG